MQGVSTRRVDDLVQSLGLAGMSKSQVSLLCRERAGAGRRGRALPHAPARRDPLPLRVARRHLSQRAAARPRGGASGRDGDWPQRDDGAARGVGPGGGTQRGRRLLAGVLAGCGGPWGPWGPWAGWRAARRQRCARGAEGGDCGGVARRERAALSRPFRAQCPCPGPQLGRATRPRNSSPPPSARSSPSRNRRWRGSSGATAPMAATTAIPSSLPCWTRPRPLCWRTWPSRPNTGARSRTLAPDPEHWRHNPLERPEPRGQAPHRRGGYLSQRRGDPAPGGDGAGRTARRVAGGPALLQCRVPRQAGTGTASSGGGSRADTGS